MNPKTKRIEKSTQYVVQIGADIKRHAKIAIAPRLSEVEIENSFPKLLEMIFGGQG